MKTYNHILVAAVVVTILTFATPVAAQISTDTISGLYAKDWHPDITQSNQRVSDTLYAGHKTRGFQWNSTSVNGWIRYEKFYDTLRPVPPKCDVVYRLLSPQGTAVVVGPIEFIHGDSTQLWGGGTIAGHGDDFSRDELDLATSGPALFNGIRITLSNFIDGGERSLLLGQIRAIYGYGDTVLVEDFHALPKFEASVNSLELGPTLVGNTSTGNFTVTNTGEWKLNITSVYSESTGFSVYPQAATITKGQSQQFTVTYAPLQAETLSTNLVFIHDGMSSPDTVLLTGVAYVPDSAQVVNTGLGEGWQLISRPFSQLAEGSCNPSPVWAYVGSYVQQDTMETSHGYWYKNPTSSIIFVGYLPLASMSANVQARWNIIAAIGRPIRAADITSAPPAMITSQFFGYNGSGYYVADTLLPGRGYWVKVSQAGQMMYDQPPEKAMATNGRIRIVDNGEVPPPPPNGMSASSPTVPSHFALEQNYPNPFNPTTKIEYRVQSTGLVSLKVYSVLGQEVASLVNEQKLPGVYRATFDGANLPSGIYFYKLQTGSYTASKKMLLMK